MQARNTAIRQQIDDNNHSKSNKRRRVLDYYELVELLGPRFENMEVADRRIVVESTIDSVFVKVLTPRFVFVQIDWFAWPEQAFLYRRDNIGAGTWDDWENMLLEQLHATASPEELLLALPTRTWNSIRDTRQKLKIQSRWGRWNPCLLPVWAEHGYCADDLEILQQYQLPFDCPKLVEIDGQSSINETPSPSHPCK